MAEERQFTRAAVRTSVAQPAISHQIRRLEAELGEVLFHRDPRAGRLTGAGEALLPHARAAVAAVERGRDAVASLVGLLRGTLTVGIVRAPVDRRIFEVLGDFHRAHPAVEIVVSEQHNEELLAAVAGGEVDAAIVGITGEPLPPGVAARVIGVEPLVLATRPGHELAHKKSVAFGSLRSYPLVTLTHGRGLRVVLERACRQAGFTPRIAAETSELSRSCSSPPRDSGSRFYPAPPSQGRHRRGSPSSPCPGRASSGVRHLPGTRARSRPRGAPFSSSPTARYRHPTLRKRAR